MALFNKLIYCGLASALSFLPQQILASDGYSENYQQNEIIEYKIKKGETLSGISQKLRIPIEELVTLNHINDINKIKEGQTIFYRCSELEKEILNNPLDKFDKYKNIVGLIENIEVKYNIPDKLLHLVVLVETKGIEEDRYEREFKRKYIDNGRFRFDNNEMYNGAFLRVKEKYPSLTEDEFKKQLATSVGVAQMMYSTAIDLGFNGSIDELRDSETNLEYAAKLLCIQFQHTKFEWKRVLATYREGTFSKKPLKNKKGLKEKITEMHIKRGEYYRVLLKRQNLIK